MSFYNFKNAQIKINNREVFANNCNIQYDTDLEPNYLTEQRHSFVYRGTRPIRGKITIDYLLTGNDPIKDFLVDEDDTLRGDFGGLIIESGYLENYSVNGRPNEAVRANAGIIFFDELKGSFNPTNKGSIDQTFLNFADVTVENLNSQSLGSIGSVQTFSYSYNSRINEDTNVGEFIPTRVKQNEKRIQGQFEIETISKDLPVSGKDAGIKIKLVHPTENISENFEVSGSLKSRETSSSANGRIRHQIEITQNYTDKPPKIDGFDPTSGEFGDLIQITGENLKNTTQLFFNNTEDTEFTVVDDTEISGKVPDDALDGPIEVFTFGGDTKSSNSFDVIDGGITIDGFTPLTGFHNDEIEITGSGFYAIDSVEFSTDASGDFETIDDNTIFAKVPETAAYDVITVTSDRRNESDSSAKKFSPFPVIDFFDPPTGIIDDTITISGRSLSGVTGVEFNQIEANSFSVNSNTEVTATVPSGNTLGIIRVEGEREVFTKSSNKFFPEVIIDKIVPNSAKIDEDVVVSGRNFIPEILDGSDLPNGQFRVAFAGDTDATGAFNRLDNERLSGAVPELADDGAVRIFRVDGGMFSATGEFFLVEGNPEFIGMSPTGVRVFDTVVIQGKNFFDITEVNLSGVNDNDIGQKVDNRFVNTDGTEISFDVPDTGQSEYRVYIQSDNGDVLSHGASGKLDLLAPLVAAESGFSGNPGDLGHLEFGEFDLGGASEQSHTSQIHNTGDFDVTLQFPSLSNVKWGSRDFGKDAQIDVDANSSDTIIKITINGTSNMNSRTETGNYFMLDGSDGIFDIDITDNS